MTPELKELPLHLQEWKEFTANHLEMIQFQTEEAEFDLGPWSMSIEKLNELFKEREQNELGGMGMQRGIGRRGRRVLCDGKKEFILENPENMFK